MDERCPRFVARSQACFQAGIDAYLPITSGDPARSVMRNVYFCIEALKKISSGLSWISCAKSSHSPSPLSEGAFPCPRVASWSRLFVAIFSVASSADTTFHFVVRSQVCSQPGTYAFLPIFSGNPDWPVMPTTHVCIGEEAVTTTSSRRPT